MVSLDITGPTVGIVDDVCLTEVHEWDVCYAVPYPTLSVELCVMKPLNQDLHYFGLSAKPLSGANSFTIREIVPENLFL